MKREAIARLMKDIILAVIAWGIVSTLMVSCEMSADQAMAAAVLFAGIPFGWRWASNIITAVSMQGVLLKLGIAVFLGWFAIFVVLIGDVIRCIAAPSAARA